MNAVSSAAIMAIGGMVMALAVRGARSGGRCRLMSRRRGMRRRHGLLLRSGVVEKGAHGQLSDRQPEGEQQE